MIVAFSQSGVRFKAITTEISCRPQNATRYDPVTRKNYIVPNSLVHCHTCTDSRLGTLCEYSTEVSACAALKQGAMVIIIAIVLSYLCILVILFRKEAYALALAIIFQLL